MQTRERRLHTAWEHHAEGVSSRLHTAWEHHYRISTPCVYPSRMGGFIGRARAPTCSLQLSVFGETR